MKSTFRLLLVLLVFIAPYSAAYAQKSVSLFSDTLQKGNAGKSITVISNGPFIYIGGQSFDSTIHYHYTPSVSKIDTSGNTIWTLTTNKQLDNEMPMFGGSIYSRSYVDHLIYDDHFLYASCFVIETGNREIWKINEQTCALVWKKEINVELRGGITLRLANNV